MANIGYIQVNRYCNQKCLFCSNPFTGRSIDLERGIELIDDFKNRNYDGIIFTGGEPTLAKNLPDWIKYAKSHGMNCRMISNGMRTSDFNYLKTLKDSGLELIHYSLYSYIPQIHDYLTDTPGSYKKIISSLQNAIKLGIRVQINTVINRYNQDHLHKTVLFLNKYFPQIKHQVWNNLDPIMMRKNHKAQNTLPEFDKFEPNLKKAMDILTKTGRTFRVEKVPLCYMKGYEHFSTETRKIVKNEERIVHFLDFREFHRDKGETFVHEFKDGCKNCNLRQICAGIPEAHSFYDYVKEKPQKLSKEEFYSIIEKVKTGGH